MPGFHEVRLPEDVERGAQGGPGFKTTVLPLASGHEKRNQDWTNSKGSWDISYGIQDKADFTRVLRFFMARRGRAYGFRFKDWSDYEVVRQQFGVADGVEVEFQLTKTYTDTVNPYVRPISKPVLAGEDYPVRVWRNNVLLAGADYAIDTTTGLITFDTPGTLGHVLEWEGEFDVPVRFDRDTFDITLQHVDAGSIPTLQIVELRPEDA